ncbi:acetyl/propionyl/methylcrotonyl-CoA carboxylase subunit alpha [Virgibacillus soli]|uniref:acetyl-CoA carboxylase biotin carboxylase subunit n=1 Tax=Paracerasibacillus soli TaxID=480284 RepID=UPI0035EDE64A
MIKKVLIANRGEIAARVIRACKKLGIQTVAVYSEADQHAPYIEMAEESALLGPPRVNDSYLNVEKLISLAKKHGVDAIHPGYGFLSENATFAKRCEAEGFIFIGPSSEVIEKMGSKIAARKIMSQANIPIIPGVNEAITSPEEAVQYAKDLGYPVMLKASAGGGGIGMEVVHSDEELRKSFENNQKRAQTFFGDGAMFMEKKIEHAHHVEIQILADKHGQVIHLYDRECSIQRRNQKVIEEGPSPFISEKTRQAMGDAAVTAAKALSYTNAGTIEFLVDQEENFYFLEMNTRIQVEHPVTEEITGIDIVAEQLRIASGQELSVKQENIGVTGHAIEARIYAEDPVTFFPSPGQILRLELPEAAYIRHEIAITKGMNVTPFYDPMVAKLIVKGKDRQEALNRLRFALENYHIEGIKTNIPMLLKVVNHKQFQVGQTTTAFVDEHYIPLIKN